MNYHPGSTRATTLADAFPAHRLGGFAVPIPRSQQAEHLDTHAERASADVLTGNLRDIRRANRWFGGTRAVLDELRPRMATWSSTEPLAILDVATGSADIPVAIVTAAARANWSVHVVATDSQPSILAVARAAMLPGHLSIEQADALALPYADDAFDVVTLSLALHHFDEEAAIYVLGEMRRVGRLALIVNDLERTWPGYLGAWLFAHLLTTNPMTRHDAPLSVRRAYTRQEALALAHAAGWHGARVRAVAPFRYVLTGRPA